MKQVRKLGSLFFITATIFCFGCQCIAMAQSRTPITKALVIGISVYQDSTIPALPFAARDAEFFASFVKSNYKNIDSRDQLLMYTDDQASLAGLSAGLDWLTEDAEKGDTLLLFFAGYASFIQNKPLNGNGLYFYDSPSQRNTSTSFNLLAQFKVLAQKKKAVFQCFGNVYPALFENRENYSDSIALSPKKREDVLFKNLIQLDRVQDRSDLQIEQESQSAKHSLISYLIKGLMGLADDDADRKITLKELGIYFNKLAVFPWIQPGILFAATSSPKDLLCYVNPTNLRAIEDDLDYSFLSPIMSLETNRGERQEIKQLSDKNRILYEDFILAIKLGHLLNEPPKNASSILDTFAKDQEMQKFMTKLRRKLAAALQDEAQQVLNAYLNVDSKELFNRINGLVRYDIYAQYLEKAIQLLGGPHYMTKILKAKKLYFEAVQKRILGQKNLNKELISESIQLLNEALAMENQASFLYNELGINYSLFGRREDAKRNFISAIEFSPTWSIPYTNLAQLYAQEDLSKALRIAKHAIRLSPHNSFAWNVEGSLQLRLHNFPAAEGSFTKALKLDSNYAVACYNLACALSLQKKTEEAYEKLEQAIQSGIVNYENLDKDPDLQNLRVFTIRWNDLLKKYFLEK